MKKPNHTIFKNGKTLQFGYTTGSCAAAASAAATQMLLSGDKIQQVKLETPKGIVLNLDIEKILVERQFVSCAVKKFSGDDPDITDGVYVYAKVHRIDENIEIKGGEGIGIVTKPGLSVEVGKPAINPIPMKMIDKEVAKVIRKYGYKGGIEVEISIPQGELLADKTYNSRLGIKGGISVLGTTGIVEPMSNQAIIDTIKLEIDMIKASGSQSIMVVLGNYGRDFAEKKFRIAFKNAVQCSNFIGEALDYISHVNFDNILIMGHGGKLIKVAGGIMNTHSSIADCRMEILAAHAALVHPMQPNRIKDILNCITIDAANEVFRQIGILKEVWQSAGDKMVYHLKSRLGEKGSLFAVIFGKDGILYQHGDSRLITEVFVNEG